MSFYFFRNFLGSLKDFLMFLLDFLKILLKFANKFTIQLSYTIEKLTKKFWKIIKLVLVWLGVRLLSGICNGLIIQTN